MKNFTKELKAILKEDPGAPIMSPDEVVKRANTMVILTNQAPPKLLALAGSSRKAILLNFKPLMITFPDQRVYIKFSRMISFLKTTIVAEMLLRQVQKKLRMKSFLHQQ